MDCLPGTLWVNRGRWNWRVKLPGEKKRKNFPLKLHNQIKAIPEEKGKDLAESLAWRLWDKATRKSSKQSNDSARITVDQAIGKFLSWADTYYRRPDGASTRERDNCELALRILRQYLREEPLDNIAYTSLLDIRDGMETSGLNRTTINQRIGIWKRFITWALDNRLCSASTKSEWLAMGSLKRNRTKAPEGKPVMPVTHLTVKKTIPYLTKQVQVMVQIQELCGARPGEICSMRPYDIERRGRIWIYRPAFHKTEHKGNTRIVVMGPRAVAILADFLGESINWQSEKNIFVSPEILVKKLKANEPCPTRSYTRSIELAVKNAKKDGIPLEHWSPNQLRHACGTRIRRKFGVEAARSVLGHSNGTRITDRYTRAAIEAEIIAAATPPMIALG